MPLPVPIILTLGSGLHDDFLASLTCEAPQRSNLPTAILLPSLSSPSCFLLSFFQDFIDLFDGDRAKAGEQWREEQAPR